MSDKQVDAGASSSINKRLFYSDIPLNDNGDIDASNEDDERDPDYAPIFDDSSDSDTDSVIMKRDALLKRKKRMAAFADEEVALDDGEIVGDFSADAAVLDGEPAPKRQKKEKIGRSGVRGISWEHHNKMLKNQGKAYVGAHTKRQMEARKIGAPCKCKNKCFEKVGEAGVKAVFENFWKIGNYNKQNTYLTSRLHAITPKRRYTNNVNDQLMRYDYTVKYGDEQFSVCRKAFPAMHGISVRRVEIHQKRMRSSVTGTPIEDKRGKAPSANKITGAKLDAVHEHIKSLPTKSSHYTRSKAPHRKYLEGGPTSIKELYYMYEFWCQKVHPDVEIVKLRYYEKIFTECYNISFRMPKKDTCGTCDKMSLDIKAKKSQDIDTKSLEEDLQQHKKLAKQVSGLLSSMALLKRPESLEPNDVVRVVCMDLQQTQPCPRLSTGMAYYLRKLWVYNFCVYDVTKGKATMFVWDEVTGGRGSDEVATCLMKWIELRQNEGQKFDVLRVFCDNCGGQNKNIFVILAALRLIHAKKLLRIEFVFMVSGHSYMPCDRSFGNIEKNFKRDNMGLQTTENYVKRIRQAVTPNFETIAMQRQDFVDIKGLMKGVTKRKTAINFSTASQLIVTYQYKEGFLLKTDYNFKSDDTNTFRCRLMKGQAKYSPKMFDLSNMKLLMKYPAARVLDKKKVDDLRSMLDYLLPLSREWLQKLITTQQELLANGAIPAVADDEDVGNDPENDLFDYDEPTRTK